MGYEFYGLIFLFVYLGMVVFLKNVIFYGILLDAFFDEISFDW